MSLPWQENLHQIRDTITNLTFACTVKEMRLPWEYRNAIIETPYADGAVDAHAGNRDYIKSRTIDVTLVHTYQSGESFKTVTNALEQVIGRGNPLELTTQEEDGTIWLWTVRLTRFDKQLTLEWAHAVEYQLTFTAPDPHQRASVKPGTLLFDNGLYLDDTPLWYLDTDPDAVTLTATQMNHTITNTGPAADEAPAVVLFGPMTGPIYFTFTDPTNAQVWWSYNANIASGEHVTVDGAQLEVVSTTASVNAYAAFALPAGQESWGRIAPGTNTVTLSCQGYSTGASFTVNWNARK